MTGNPPRRPKTASQWLFGELRDAIIRGELPAGQPIRQDAIALKYNVSRMPVREAMRLLEAEGLVEQEPHHGAVVAELDADDALELFEIRMALEVLGIRRSFPLLKDDQLERIEEAHKALIKARRNELLLRHREFHLSLYAAAGSRLQKLIGDQLDAAQRYHLRFGRDSIEVSETDAQEHLELVEAAYNRDVRTGLRIMRSHLGESGVEISRSIARRQRSARTSPEST